MAARIRDAVLDEISTVDDPANQYGLIVLAKRATQKETNVADYFDAEGDPVDITALDEGDYVQDANGEVFQIGFQEADEIYDGADERELQEVGKSAFFDQVAKGGDEFFSSLSKQLNDAVSTEAERDILTKALTVQAEELAKANARADEAYQIAKAAADREEISRYISKAAEYNVPVAPEVLGPVLKRMADTMSYDDCAVVASLLETSGDIFKSYGLDGEADADDPFEQVEQYMAEHANDAITELGKRNGEPARRTVLSKEAAVASFFDSNPREYSALKRSRRV